MKRWLMVAIALPALAHVGSPDVFFEGSAGPHKLYVAVRTPAVIPGVAEIEIRVPGGGVDEVKITPMPLSGPGARFAPTPDAAKRSSEDPSFFSGTLWMMSTGSWQVRVEATGAAGKGEARVPVPALARRIAGMDQTLGAALLGLMLFLAVGAVAIAGAATREGKLPPGMEPPPENQRRARITMAITATVVIAAIVLGNEWWKAEAAGYSKILFKPLGVKTSLDGSLLTMRLEHTGWLQSKDFDDLVPDHGYLMHLFIANQDLSRVWHLHPRMASSGVFGQSLPTLPAGRYRLYGDIVHRSGLPETVAAELDLPAIEGVPLTGDDSESSLTAGYRMVLDGPAELKKSQLQLLKFRLVDSQGRPADGMETYLGMPAHAAVIKKDGQVFAHLHPTGTVPMASLAMTQPDNPHAGHSMHSAITPEVTFPYGFPESGDYRMFVQMKRAGTVETGAFDIRVID
jgi:hypothetical protein